MKQYPKYKDSGVSWIGEIPEGWETLKLKFLCSYFQAGSNLTSFQIKPEGTYSVYGGNGIRGYFDEYNWDGGCNLIGRQGALCGNVHLVKDKFWATEHAIIIKANEKSSDDFLFYLMTAMNLNQYASQTAAQPGLAVDRIKQVKACCPPLPEQHAIVSYLDKKTAQIDRFISEATKEIEKLNELKQAQIAHLVTHGLNSDVPMKNSGIVWIGQVPEHWEVRKMKFLFDERTEKNHPEEPILCATQAHGVIPQSMYDNRVVVVNTGFQNLKFVEVGDFVISLRSFQGGIEYAHYQGIISAAYTILRSKGDLTNDYTRYLFKSFPFIQLLKTCVKGIREGQNINYDMLKNNYLFVPPKQEQTAIVSAINSLNKRIDMLTSQLVDQINHLKELKQRIISDAVTGKIDVREVNN